MLMSSGMGRANVKHEMEVQSGVPSACDSSVNSSGDLLDITVR